MAVTIQTRRDSAADWTTANPVLALGEIGIEVDTDKAKYGDGVTPWTSLDYWLDPDALPDGTNGQIIRYGVSWEASSALVVADDGNVGIGTDTPGNRLAVQSDIDTNLGVLFTSGEDKFSQIFFGDPSEPVTKGRIRYDNLTNYMHFQTAGAEKMRIDSAGNVGIGTTAPTTLLQVEGAAQLLANLNSTSTASYVTFSNNQNTANNSIRIGSLGFDMTVWTGNIERMRIDAAGNVIINNIPTAAAGLPSGALWSNGGVINIVP
jgi:hypothetical protein